MRSRTNVDREERRKIAAEMRAQSDESGGPALRTLEMIVRSKARLP